MSTTDSRPATLHFDSLALVTAVNETQPHGEALPWPFACVPSIFATVGHTTRVVVTFAGVRHWPPSVLLAVHFVHLLHLIRGALATHRASFVSVWCGL